MRSFFLFLITQFFFLHPYFLSGQQIKTAPHSGLLEIYCDSADIIAKNDIGAALNFCEKKAKAFFRKKERDKAIALMNKAKNLAEQNDDYRNVIKTENTIAKMYAFSGKDSLAYQTLQKALALAVEKNDSLNIALIYTNIGNVLDNMARYEEAIEALQKSYSIFIVTGNIEKAAYPLNTIGIINVKTGNYKEAEADFLKLEDITKKSGNTFVYHKALKNLALVYKHFGDDDKALDILKETLKFEIETKNYESLGKTANNIANIFVKKENYDSAVFYYRKALIYKKKYNSEKDLISSNVGLAKILLKQNNIDSAIAILNKQYIRAYKYNLPREKKMVLELLCEADYRKGNFERAYDELKQFKSISDSIDGTEVKKHIAELEARFKAKQKEAQILKLTNENLEKEVGLAKQKQINIVIASLLILILLLGFYFRYKYKQRVKYKLLETSFLAAEKEKTKIGREIHDGIAGALIKTAYELDDTKLSDKLLKLYNELRNFSHRLDSSKAEDEPFAEKIADLIPDQGKALVNVKIYPKDLKIKEPAATHFYRIIQELISNGIKHSKASKTLIVISLSDNTFSLKYKDDGVGMRNAKKGVGLRSIDDRVKLMHGAADYGTGSEGGFFMNIDIPYKSI